MFSTSLLTASCAARISPSNAVNHVLIVCNHSDAATEVAKLIRRQGYVPVQERTVASLLLHADVTEGQRFSCAQFTSKEYPHYRSAALRLTDLNNNVKWASYASRGDNTERGAVCGAVRDAIRSPNRGLAELVMTPLEAIIRVKRSIKLPTFQSLASYKYQAQ
ncbi:MAG: hypothetical protein JNJ83_04855 [Verrucomicrobiaceae bacterium]|nr:hypothetical protein [Verrucomicrobiaceae bacterium]